jgi:hypothetical protein
MVRHRVLVLLAAVALLGAMAAVAPAAQGDTLIQPLSGARNLAEGGGWLAWAQPAHGGRWRLAVRSPQGVTTTPAIPDFGAAPDPNIGSDRFGISGRRLLVVYSRCTGTSATTGCDIYRYDLADGTEAKVMAISTAEASETAPAIRSGQWSFVRRSASASRSGVYGYEPHGGVRRLSSVIARETVMLASRVAYAYTSSKGGGVAVRLLSGRGAAGVVAAGEPAVPSSLVGSRYRCGWLMPASDGAVSVIRTSRLLFGGPVTAVQPAMRNLPASTNSITMNDSSVPDKYLDQTGISTLSPPLF